MRSSITYLIFSVVVIVVGFLLSMGAPGSPSVLFFLFTFGTVGAWIVLFAVGWILHGRGALWLLIVAPLAFFQFGFLVSLALPFQISGP